MRRTGFWWFVIVIFILVDVYFFQAVTTVMQGFSPSVKLAVTIIYWIIALAAWLALFAMPYLRSVQITKFYRNYSFSVLVGLFIAKLVGCVFFAADDIRRGI
jgi:uncharacterized membrane protein YhaH (DUF805 family)